MAVHPIFDTAKPQMPQMPRAPGGLATDRPGYERRPAVTADDDPMRQQGFRQDPKDNDIVTGCEYDVVDFLV